MRMRVLTQALGRIFFWRYHKPGTSGEYASMRFVAMCDSFT